MPRPPRVTVDDLLSLVGSGPPVPAGRLLTSLGVSRPVLGRLVAEAGSQVLRIGKARATRYASRARTPAGSSWPIWRMRPDATLEELGVLHALRGERFQFETNGDRPNLTRVVEEVPGHFPGLPWFLDDLRPQGFLGRTLARQQATRLGVPRDLSRWGLADTLVAITRTGGTGIGDLLPGSLAVDEALAECANPGDALGADQREARYADMAEAVLAGEVVGSSPGGEQPKFTATVETAEGRYAALVKFAVPDSGQAARRWADLLVCEQLALRCLEEAGLPAPRTNLIDSNGYTCLEVRRFDRTPVHLGRIGFVSLAALDAAFVGSGGDDWGIAGHRLAQLGWITRETAAQMACLHWFGRMIGNSDMHPGNLGFQLVDHGPLALAPVYDMLPMSLAPSSTGAVRPASPLALAAPTRPGQSSPIGWAARLAEQFWMRVAASERIQGEELRRIARDNAAVVARYAEAFASDREPATFAEKPGE